MWQKFFLLLRMALIAPHCSNTSDMICSVAFSGRPPTNTVLQPGGLSRVAGGGRSVKHKRVHTYNQDIWSRWKWLANLKKKKERKMLILSPKSKMNEWIKELRHLSFHWWIILPVLVAKGRRKNPFGTWWPTSEPTSCCSNQAESLDKRELLETTRLVVGNQWNVVHAECFGEQPEAEYLNLVKHTTSASETQPRAGFSLMSWLQCATIKPALPNHAVFSNTFFNSSWDLQWAW